MGQRDTLPRRRRNCVTLNLNREEPMFNWLNKTRIDVDDPTCACPENCRMQSSLPEFAIHGLYYLGLGVANVSALVFYIPAMIYKGVESGWRSAILQTGQVVKMSRRLRMTVDEVAQARQEATESYDADPRVQMSRMLASMKAQSPFGVKPGDSDKTH